MTRKILLSFDVEEFDMPIEFGHPIELTEQMAIGMKGLNAISPILNDEEFKATLFTTANFADYFPEQISSLAKKHEIASHTYFHSHFEYKDLATSKRTLEEITGKEIYGLRMPKMKAVDSNHVFHAGYTYDASIHPTWLPGRYNNLNMPRKPYFENKLLRIPATVTPSLRIPLFWLSFKNFPFEIYRRMAIHTLKKDGILSLYYHPWEFIDINHYGLPTYTRRICGEKLLERLLKFLVILKAEGEFITMYDFTKSIFFESKSIRSVSRDVSAFGLID